MRELCLSFMRRFVSMNAVAVLVFSQVAVYANFINVGSADAGLYQSYCTADQQGNNDVSGEDDINQSCYTTDPVADIFVVAWTWDDATFIDGYACTLLDTNSNGTANYAICAAVSGGSGAQAPAGTFTYYSCDDSAALSCGNAAVFSAPPTTVSTLQGQVSANECSISSAGGIAIDPFSSSPVSETLALCFFEGASFNFSVSTPNVLIDTCSYDSAPTTSAQDCNFATPNQATLTLTKILSPTYDPATVSLTVEGAVEASGVGHQGSTGSVVIPTTEGVTIGENAVGGTDLSDYSTSFSCSRGGSVIWSSSGATGASSRSRTIPQGIIQDGDNIDCTITNVLIGNGIDITKVIDATNGGDAVASDFSFVIDGYNNNQAIQFESDGSNSIIVPTGTYDIYEVEENTNGYTTTYDGCTDVFIDENNPVFADCTITNTAQPATITISKNLIQNDGATNEITEFGVTLEGTTVSEADAFNNQGTITYEVPAGSYTVTETGPTDGYTVTNECSDITVTIGQNYNCTITNNDQPGTLNVFKTVINDNGAMNVASDFSFTISGVDGAINFDTNGEASVSLPAGTYDVSEVAFAGYQPTYDGCSQVVIANGQSTSCYITNDDLPGYVTIFKEVINDDGGTLQIDDFMLFIEGYQGVVESGVVVLLDAGNYNAGENNEDGYTASNWTGDCASNGFFTVLNGGVYNCTITNDDQPATLTIVKDLTNDNGGTLDETDFSVFVNSTEYFFDMSGQIELTLPAGSYNVNPVFELGYETTTMLCAGLDLSVGQEAMCTVTSNDIPPVIEVIKQGAPCDSSTLFDFTITHSEMEDIDFSLTPDCLYNTAEISATRSLVSDIVVTQPSRYMTGDNFQAGSVTVSEEGVDNWYQAFANCRPIVDNGYTTPLDAARGHMGMGMGEGVTSFDIQIGQRWQCIFTNFEYSTVTVTKFHDINQNSEWDEDEPALPDWEMQLTSLDCRDVYDDIMRTSRYLDDMPTDVCSEEVLTEVTGTDGVAVFDNLDLRTTEQAYVSEVLQDEWVQSAMYCDYETDFVMGRVNRVIVEPIYDDIELYNMAPVLVAPGQTLDCYAGNYREPQIELEKTNDTTGAVNPGTEITFTLTVTIPPADESGEVTGAGDGADYVSVELVDNLQDEFEYVPGSFSAESSEQGDMVALGVVTDPNYASPGTWTLTNLANNVLVPGEVITLTYRAIVGQSTPAGVYATTATVTGFGDNSQDIVVTATSDDEVRVQTPSVLGVSTTTPQLAATGENQYSGAIVGAAIGLLGILIVRRKSVA